MIHLSHSHQRRVTMLSNDDLGNILDIISLHEDWDELSDQVGFDVKELNAKVYQTLYNQAQYDMECG